MDEDAPTPPRPSGTADLGSPSEVDLASQSDADLASQSDADLASQSDADLASQSIGAYLAAQRRLRGISRDELARQTRIPLRSLERLEAGSFDSDVDGFVRGFVRTVAEALGLDPDETLTRTMPEPGPDGRRRASQQLSLQRVFATVLGLALLVGVGFGVQLIAIELAGETPRDPNAAVMIRRDPVRALAEAQGVAALSPTPALALASTLSGPSSEDAGDVEAETGASIPDGPVAPVASPSRAE